MLRLNLAKRLLMKCGKKRESKIVFLNRPNRSKQTFTVDFGLTIPPKILLPPQIFCIAVIK